MEAREPHGLSGGEKQRLVIAGILAMRPTYLVFDEPSSMLDSNGRAEVRSIICRLQTQGAGILHITHDLTECAGATRVYVLDSGRLVFEVPQMNFSRHLTCWRVMAWYSLLWYAWPLCCVRGVFRFPLACCIPIPLPTRSWNTARAFRVGDA